MRRSAFFSCIAFIILAFLAIPPGSAREQLEDSLQILMLNSYDSNTEPYVSATEAFQIQMQQQYAFPVSFRDINLEERHGDDKERERLIEALLDNLHEKRPPDLVVAVGPPAVSYWLRHRDNILPGVPLIAAAGEGRFFQSDLQPGDYAVVTRLRFSEFIEDFLRLKPTTSHVLAVFGATPYERRLAAFMQSQLGDLKNRINFEYTNDLTLTELLARVKQLGENSAVFYVLFNTDPEGITLQHGSALPLIREASTVPVLGTLENQMGRGIVGGRLIQLKQIGVEMALAASTLLEEQADEAGWKTLELSTPTYDWRELQATGIALDSLPPASNLLFKPLSPWRQYAWWIALASTILIGQSLLITTLLLERQRRRRAESGQASLSGKLITAHEDERRRLARELHDDLSQRLARLSMDVGTMTTRDKPGQNAADLQKLHNDLIGVSKDCHDLSYRLHPSLLDDLGIVTALRSECQSVRRQTAATLVEDIADIDGRLSRDAALCIYRIAQEALHNAVKHAEADTIEIALHRRGDRVTVSVRDTGKGFLYARDNYPATLGLSSMRERARLLGAELDISSHIGKGTTVTVSIPTQESNQ